MKSHKLMLAGMVVLFAIGIAVDRFDVIAQNKTESPAASQNASSVPEGGMVRLSARSNSAAEASSKATVTAAFESAALRNSQLQSSLGWTFGGKQQLGWYLYTPLVANLIGAESDGTAGEFAMRLSQWQRQKEVEPTGVLDNTTWSQMISTFQSQRMKNKALPAADQLVTVPVADCYDPSRPEELRKVDSETFAAYKRLVAAASNDPSLGLQVAGGGLAPNERFLKIVSAYRSQQYQDQLRRNSPNSGRAGLAVHSPHSTGRALDLYVGGEPVDTKDENRALQTRTRVYRWLVKNAAKFGFQPYFYEPWHWEFTGRK